MLSNNGRLNLTPTPKQSGCAGRRCGKKDEVVHSREGDLARRELAVTEREQKADVGFADRAKVLADEATRQHLANQSESERLEELATQLEADRQLLEEKKAGLTLREQAVGVAEQTRDAGFADERAAFNAEMRGERAKIESEISDTREKKSCCTGRRIRHFENQSIGSRFPSRAYRA